MFFKKNMNTPIEDNWQEEIEHKEVNNKEIEYNEARYEDKKLFSIV